MNSKEYKKLKREAEERHRKAIEAADTQRIADLAAIERVWAISHPSKGGLQSTVNNGASYGKLSNAIKEALPLVPETFTKNHIKEAIRKVNPEVATTCKDSSLTGGLSRLSEKGVIKQTRAGKGSTPSEYEKIPESKQVNTDNNTDSNKDSDLPDFMKD